jgi:DNA-binding MarR family transcriptional regulator
VLSAIASGDDRASRIASKFAMGKPAISASVDALCQRGLLERASVDHDQRAAALRLTATGRAALAHTESAMVARLREICGDRAEAQHLYDALVWLGGAIDEATGASRRAPELQRGRR